MAKSTSKGGESASIPVQEAVPQTAAPRAASGRRAENPDLVKSEQAAMQAAEQMAEELAGIVMDDTDKAPTPKPAAKKAAEPTQADADASLSTQDEEPAFNPDAPVLGEDDGGADFGDEAADGAATTDDESDSPDEQDDDPKIEALKKENFRQREKKRELEAQIKALNDEKAELQRKLSTLETTPTALPDLGIYAEVKSTADVDKLEAQQSQFADYLENLLDDIQEVYTLPTASGQEQEFTRQQLRDFLRGAKANVKLAERARNALKVSHETEALARVKYPFVFDAKSKHNNVVLDLVKETPALNALPNKPLLLGRLAVGKLVESGEYYLTKRGAKAPAKAQAQERPRTVVAAPAAARRSAPVARQESVLDRLNRGDSNAQEEAALALLESHPGLG